MGLMALVTIFGGRRRRSGAGVHSSLAGSPARPDAAQTLMFTPR